MTTRADFETTLAAAPQDWACRAVYSDWLEEHGFTEEAQRQRTMAAKHRLPPTPLERRAMLAISPGLVTYLPGSFDKKFAREMSEEAEFHGDNATLTVRQAWWLWQHVYRYRRQIHARDLLAEAAKQINETEPPKKNRAPGNGVTETTRERRQRTKTMPRVPKWLRRR